MPWPPLARHGDQLRENEWREWEISWRSGGNRKLEAWARWIYLWERDWPEWYWVTRSEYERRFRYLLAEGFEEGSLGGLLLVNWSPEGKVFLESQLERFLTPAPSLPIVLVNLMSGDPQYTLLLIPGVSVTLDRRVDREFVHRILRYPMEWSGEHPGWA
jgi:hypothetical protein